MSKLALCAVFLLFATFASALNYSTPIEAITSSTKAQKPEAIVVDYFGLTKAQVEVIRDKLVEYLDMNVNNEQLTNYMWDYCRREEPNIDHLITISKCFDYCYEGSQPNHYVTIDIDRGTNRFMMVGRTKC